jgi:hypothetical protein
MDVVRDLLDTPVIDRNGLAMGRVDGIVAELHGDAPPHLARIAIGPIVLGERLHPAIGRCVAAIENACGLAGERPVEIGMNDLTIAEGEVRVHLAMGATAAAAVERIVRRWVARIPGAR